MNLAKAIQVYQILGQYLPDISDENIDVLEYANTILNNTIQGKNPDALIRSLSIMSEKSLLELTKINAYGRLSLFEKCIIVNRLWLLNDYMRQFGL